MVEVHELEYGKIYPLKRGKEGIYMGNTPKGRGRVLYRSTTGYPIVDSFDLKTATLEEGVLKGRFYFLHLKKNQELFADEILDKKGL